jgi:hypothetical protein
VVHALPSSHGTGALTQPVDGLQLSVVQGFMSSQFVGGFSQQPSAVHTSSVHKLPSAQSAGVMHSGVFTQPVRGSQESVVQGFLSSQGTGV